MDFDDWWSTQNSDHYDEMSALVAWDYQQERIDEALEDWRIQTDALIEVVAENERLRETLIDAGSATYTKDPQGVRDIIIAALEDN